MLVRLDMFGARQYRPCMFHEILQAIVKMVQGTIVKPFIDTATPCKLDLVLESTPPRAQADIDVY